MSIIRKDVSEYDLSKPSEEKTLETLIKTKLALEESIQGKIAVSKVGAEAKKKISDPKYYQYNDKVIQMHEQPTDPMLPVKFKHRRVPRGPTEDPTPIDRSPPRKLTLKDQLDWKIPPCISNWKNSKGYTIPLEMRLSADGRHLHDCTFSDRFPKLAESIYQAERNAREEIKAREDLQRKLLLKEGQSYEKKMQDIASQARAERAQLLKLEKLGKRDRTPEERDEIRYERSKEIERDRRIEVAKKKHKRDRNDDREISEKIALGQARPTASNELDQRLFNQNEGVHAGFGSDDEYNIFDKPLFTDRSAAGIYRNIKETSDDNFVNVKSRQPVQFEKVEDA
jgi:SNW domain-containing protein 1